MKFLFIVLSLLISVYTNAQTLRGVVKGVHQLPLSEANIRIVNTNYTSVTNHAGSFIIESIPNGKYLIEVSHAGYRSTLQHVNINGRNTSIEVQLAEADKQLTEVTVTAQKREEKTNNIPASITALSKNQVESYRVWNLKDLTAISPNLYAANPGDNRNVTSIRGVTNSSYDPSVTTYIDEVNQFSLDTYIPQLFDVERIEVLRGPQGTLYGRNAMGGVINILTRQPTNTVKGFVEIDLGNYNMQRINMGVRLPLIDNKLFLGVAGQYTNFGGFYTNQFNNTKLDKQHSFLGNYYLKFIATPALNVTLNVKNYANRNNGPFALAASPEAALSEPFKVNQNATTTMVDNILNSSLAINYKSRGFNFTSSSTYQKNYRYYTSPIDGDFSPLDAVSIINNYGRDYNKVEVATQEFRFSSPVTLSPLTWTAGLYGFYRYSPTKTGTHYGTDAAALGAPPDATSINTNTERNKGMAAFGQLSYSVATKLDITLGLRYDHEHKRSAVRGDYQPDGEEAVPIRPDTSAKANFHALSPKISLMYHFNTNSNVYASYSRGFRAGGISQLSADPSQIPLQAYQPEFSNNYEVGSKNFLADKKLRIDVSAFYTHVNNAQVPTLILPDAITVVRNTGSLNSRGAELQLQALFWPWLNIDYNFGYTHARYDNLSLASNDGNVNLAGNRPIFTPNLTSMLAAQYVYLLNIKKSTRLIIRGEWRHIGDQYFDLKNNINQQAYSQLNSRLGIASKYLETYFWANNITNKRYIDYAYDFGAAHLGNPATYGITLKREF